MDKKLISIVTPCFNEEAGISDCYNAVKEIFDSELALYDYEHIFCDNSSTDNTVNILKELASKNKSIKVIVNSRNFGIFKNTYNGVMNANGDAVILLLPADLQDPPSLIPSFVKQWELGYEIVYGIRATREESFLLCISRKFYYRLLSRLTYVNYPVDVGDFQLIDKCVLNAMKKIDDAQPFMRLMTFDCGFKSTGIKYNWSKRKHGKSKNNLRHMFDQGLNGIISFSGAPLRLCLITGFIISTISILYAIYIFLISVFGKVDSQPGVPTLLVAMFFFAGVQLTFLGVLGEYIFAIFNQVRRKPLVIERERINFNEIDS
jgi:glycosyltransferase involved in cell wall biosynthesis